MKGRHLSPSTSVNTTSKSQLKVAGRKAASVGFITLILTLNFWVIGHFSDSKQFLLLQFPLYFSFAAIFLGGILIFAHWLRELGCHFFNKAQPEDPLRQQSYTQFFQWNNSDSSRYAAKADQKRSH